MNKVHVAIRSARLISEPTRTRCGRELDAANRVEVKIVDADDPRKYEGITCHYCRFGRIL